MDYRVRQKRLMDALNEHKLHSLLITHLPNIRYLCGFTGSSGVLVVAQKGERRRELAFFTDGRYTEQAREQTVGARVVIAKGPALTASADWITGVSKPSDSIGFEAEHLPFAAYLALTKETGKSRFKPTFSIVERLRMVKEEKEIAQIRSAVLLASKVFQTVITDIKPGVPESRIAAEIEYLCRRMGAEGMSFATLVAAGKRSALPHGVASRNLVPSRGFVILDFGVILGGYCSDMTRTVHVGRPDKAALAMYEAVLAAQLAGISAVGPGIKPEEVDFATRNVLKKAGLGRYFTHSTGHGVGLEIHEPPGLRKAATSKTPKSIRRRSKTAAIEVLEQGMVITIEPGVYIPGKGGVRIEDMVLVTKQGCQVLTPTSKELIVI